MNEKCDLKLHPELYSTLSLQGWKRGTQVTGSNEMQTRYRTAGTSHTRAGTAAVIPRGNWLAIIAPRYTFWSCIDPFLTLKLTRLLLFLLLKKVAFPGTQWSFILRNVFLRGIFKIWTSCYFSIKGDRAYLFHGHTISYIHFDGSAIHCGRLTESSCRRRTLDLNINWTSM